MNAVLFDLDNTLYHPGLNLFALIDVRINGFMLEIAGIPADEVDGLRKRYWHDYGATLQGLIRHHNIDPESYLDYVHDVDVTARLRPDQILQQNLAKLQIPCYIFTNGSRQHAERVLLALGIAEQFAQIFDIRIAAYQPKPNPEPYHGVLQSLGIPARECIMIEDCSANLNQARTLGMKTILVQDGKKVPGFNLQVDTAAAAAEAVWQWTQKPESLRVSPETRLKGV
ncbi:MAG: pyrimidine 5'-nucleotidase [Desulfuromonadales bacterium]|nr:pyrimidine 5'-nucleotidase [Desulfuromonadales bacterium]